MKKTLFLITLSGILLSGSLCVAEEDVAAGTKLTGEFHWRQGTTGDLEARFEPTGEGKWDVSFHFEFRGDPHVYTGTAEGSLSDGKLKGTVLNEGGKRTFTFSGKIENGAFEGSHAELRDGRPRETGTLSLNR